MSTRIQITLRAKLKKSQKGAVFISFQKFFQYSKKKFEHNNLNKVSNIYLIYQTIDALMKATMFNLFRTSFASYLIFLCFSRNEKNKSKQNLIQRYRDK